MPVRPKKWGGPCAIRQQSLSINLRSQGRCQGPGERQICYCDRFTGAGPWPDASPSPPAPSPPCIPPCMAHLLPYPCGTWLSDRALTLQIGPPALPSSLNTAAPALLLPVWLCVYRDWSQSWQGRCRGCLQTPARARHATKLGVRGSPALQSQRRQQRCSRWLCHDSGNDKALELNSCHLSLFC